MINIDFLNNQKIETQCFEEIIKNVISEALKIHNIQKDAEVSVVFVDDEEIRKINNEFRNIDASTDVLSFPQYEYEKEGEISSEDEILILGDIIISLEHAISQANEYGHSVNREVGYLTSHSILHLLGYDHMEEEEKNHMRTKEEEIMSSLGLTREEN